MFMGEDLESRIKKLEEDVKKNTAWRKFSQLLISVSIIVLLTWLLYVLGNQ